MAKSLLAQSYEIDDFVKECDTGVKNLREFNYNLNDKNVKSKLLKGTKRQPFQVEEKSACINLIFNVGSWLTVVLPTIKYLSKVLGEKTCVVNSSTIQIISVKNGLDCTGKHVDTQIHFHVNGDIQLLYYYYIVPSKVSMACTLLSANNPTM